jgi:GNAT superfamily N-acetyltransferase
MTPRGVAVRITRARERELADVAALFDAYRPFYHRPSNPRAAYRYLRARLTNHEATIFLAKEGSDAVGFTLLYPTFSSVAMRPVWILNDRYVRPNARRRGIATRLLDHARAMATRNGAARMVLDTARADRGARRLYSACGWSVDDLSR